MLGPGGCAPSSPRRRDDRRSGDADWRDCIDQSGNRQGVLRAPPERRGAYLTSRRGPVRLTTRGIGGSWSRDDAQRLEREPATLEDRFVAEGPPVPALGSREAAVHRATRWAAQESATLVGVRSMARPLDSTRRSGRRSATPGEGGARFEGTQSLRRPDRALAATPRLRRGPRSWTRPGLGEVGGSGSRERSRRGPHPRDRCDLVRVRARDCRPTTGLRRHRRRERAADRWAAPRGSLMTGRAMRSAWGGLGGSNP
ncbi:MAG: hypothetical protein KatS3mg065_0358 [Chloroflexota bacterium]|nr:MAG: hypothetical protein KatS3mg065_0358 [Chloroflexota bacterium]